MIKLIKPGIIMGNLITALGGYFLASGKRGPWLMFLGLGLVIAAGCVANNYIDRESDRKMERTKSRPIITLTQAIILNVLLGGSGFLILWEITPLAALPALLGYFIYVALYSFIKYKSSIATLVGSLAGAIPPVVGYTSVTGRLDAGAGILFLMLICWQMPHFYAIALYRMHEYATAGIPILPLKKGVDTTKWQMVCYTIVFLGAATLPTVCGYTGYLYLTIATSLGFIWVLLALRGFTAPNNTRWARQMFLFSLILITSISLSL